MIGLSQLFNTLSRRLDAEEREWRSLNRARDELRPGKLYAAVLCMSVRPAKWAFRIFVVVSIATIISGVVDPRRWAIFEITRFDIADRTAYFMGLWSIQAGLIAVLYPIVISFVTLLLSRQRSSASALPIYLHDSAAQLSGWSALLLVAEMGLQYMWIPYVSDAALMNWIPLDGSWFMLNVALTFYFLEHTYQFIKPARRFEITRRYLVNVVWPREARRHLASHFFRAAIGEQLLPGPAYDGTASQPSVLLGSAGIGGKNLLLRNIPKRRVLSDVRFRVLGWATASWLRRANKRGRIEGKPSPVANVIAFPLDPFSSYAGPTTLCALDGDVSLTWYEKLLITWSFSFSDPPKERVVDVQLNDIFSDAQADAIDALRSDDAELFREQVGRLTSLYESLIVASEVFDDTGKPSSLLLLPTANSFFGDTLSNTFNSRFIDLFEAAAQKMSGTTAYVQSLSHIPNRLFVSAAKGGVMQLKHEIIELSPMLYFSIERWWSSAMEMQGNEKSNICSGVVLKPPSRGIHERAVQRFVESWESFQRLMTPRNVSEWKEFVVSSGSLKRHLYHTVALLSATAIRGDRIGAEWLSDVLVKWHAELAPWLRYRTYELWNPRFVTAALLGDEWAAVRGQLSGLVANVVGEPNARAVFASVVLNLWRDLCCVAIYIHLLWGSDCECETSLSAMVARALIGGTRLRGGGPDGEKPYASADELFVSMLRQHCADSRYKGYLDSCIKEFLDLAEIDVVSGRVYSSHGIKDLDYLDEGQLLALLLVSPHGWTPNPEICTLLIGWMESRDDDLKSVRSLLKRWSGALKGPDFAARSKQYDCLKSKEAPDFDVHRSGLARQLDSLRDQLVLVHEEVVAKASIDDLRLAQIGRWASELAFRKESAGFPISAFQSVGVFVGSDNEMGTQNSVKIGRMQRGEFTKPLLAQIAINEEELLANVVREHAAVLVLSAAIHKLAPVAIEANTPEKYWTEFKKFVTRVQAKGLHPVLLLENPTIPEWIYEWGNSRFGLTADETPDDLFVLNTSRPELTGYEFDLNGVPVVSAQLRATGSSILLVLESFAQVDFELLADGSFVTATVTDSPEEQNLVDLKLAWQVRSRIDTNYPSARLVYTQTRKIKLAGQN